MAGRAGHTRQRQKVSTCLVFALEAVLPDTHDVAMAWAWKPGADEVVPDVMVHLVTTESACFTGLPALVIDVASGGGDDDIVVTSGRCAAAGLPHYWVLDRRDEVLDAFALDGGLYRSGARLSSTSGPQRLDLGVATVELDLSKLL